MKQRNIPKIGASLDSLFTCMPLLGIANFLSIAIILYSDIRPFLLIYIPWMTLWIFLLALVVFAAGMMVLIYKFVLPSIWTFRGKQMFGFENTVARDLKKIKEHLGIEDN